VTATLSFVETGSNSEVAETQADTVAQFRVESIASAVDQATPQLQTRSPIQRNWHINFSIPEFNTFSDHVKEAISTGVVTGKAKREIIQVLKTYMTAYTHYLKPEAYNAVCQKFEDNEAQRTYVSC